uniref:Beta-lactamase n=1 Tax=Solibacter usitatus (strain Ellin6076) TaxID=234267 RepID=Q024P5_SOLUE
MLRAIGWCRTKAIILKSVTPRFLIPIALSLASAVAFAADPPLDTIFAPLAGPDTPGLAVLVRQDGRTVFQHGYGVRDLRSLAKIDTATDFRLASFTKQFTAMAIMLLVHDGKLRYDQTLTEIFPDFPAYGKTITIRHLLTHTAGLPDYEDLMDEAEKGKPPIWTLAHQIQDREVLDLLKQQTRPKFAAGTSWSYSNSAYVVLGLIVAKVSGQTYGDFLRARIFQPLHMDQTLAFVNGSNTVPNRAYGHSKRQGKFVQTDQSPTSATLGDGGVYSNIADLAKWDDALARHTLLGEPEMQPALVPAKLADGSATRWPNTPGGDNLAPGRPVEYGFGWFLDSWQGRPRMWHTGTTQGFRTVIERFPESQVSVIILSNRTDLDPAALAERVAGQILKK